MTFIIIGGDAAGMSAASRAKRNNPAIEVIVLEKTHDVSYSACNMPYNIADTERDIDDLVVRKAEVFIQKLGIRLLTGHLVEEIDPARKTVSGVNDNGEKFEFNYDKLLIASGGSPVTPNIPGINLSGVMVLKNLYHGREIKSYIKEKKVQKVVIIGMGYIGLEMCETFRALSVDVTMVDVSPTFLTWMPKDLSEIVRNEIESKEVLVKTGINVKKIELKNELLKVVCTDSAFEADLVFVAIGIKPNSELAMTAGLKSGPQGTIAVDKSLKTSEDHIFAAGDCADTYHVVTGKKAWVPLALRANRAGWAVADNICGKKVELPGITGTSVFKVFDLEIARTGLTEKEALDFGFDPVSVSVQTNSRAHTYPDASPIWIYMLGDQKTGRLLGTQMVGKEGVAHRINTISVALHVHMTVDQFCQTDLAYAPPFGPVWDPLLIAANQLQKRIK